VSPIIIENIKGGKVNIDMNIATKIAPKVVIEIKIVISKIVAIIIRIGINIVNKIPVIPIKRGIFIIKPSYELFYGAIGF